MLLDNLKNLSQEQLIAMIASLQKGGTKGMKVSEKKAVSVYGLGKLPVTLYKSQWEALFARVDEIKAFIKENDALLAVKHAAPAKQ